MTAGCRKALLSGVESGAEFPLLILYPSHALERAEQLGPFPVSVAMNAPVAAGPFPLVVISHGSGGSHLVYRTLAAHLARSGFVVVLPEHPRNNRNNNELAGTRTLLENRPRELRRTLDWAYADPELGPQLMPERVAVIGHSMGGYTALAVAGGRPWSGPHESPDGQPRPVPVTPDPRVQALVLLAPATPWFMAPGALQEVRVPIQLWSGEQDTITPVWHAELVERGVPKDTLVERRIVSGAGHFSFLSPFPPAMTRPDFPPSQDPPGFDRARFQEELSADIVRFLGWALQLTKVDYTIRRHAGELDSTTYVEISPGSYTGEHWQEGSIFISEAAFSTVEGLLEKHFPGYSHFGVNDLPAATGRAVIAEWREVAAQLSGLSPSEAYQALQLERSYRVWRLDEELSSDLPEIAALLRQLADECERLYQKSETLCILGM